jgi:hypothetical protein
MLKDSQAVEEGAKRSPTVQGVEKGSDARRRPKTGREAYSLYVERPVEGANEADSSLSAAGSYFLRRTSSSGADQG